MLSFDSVGLRVLYLGGTGTISASCVRLSVASGMQVSVLNRGNNSKQRDLPESVEWLTGDVTDEPSLVAALGDRTFDAVVDFLSSTPRTPSERCRCSAHGPGSTS